MRLEGWPVATAGAAARSGPASRPHGPRGARIQNIENNPMHSSQGCRRDVYGFSEIA
jgi:hypothetical protein